MSHFHILAVCLVVVSYPYLGYSGYQTPHMRIADSSGHDYFTANQNQEIQLYLNLIEMAHTDKVVGWIRSGRINNALDDCKYTLDRFPNHPKGLMLVGSVANLTKNASLALTYFERAVNLYPQYALTHAQYGSYLVDIGNFKVGIARLKRAVEMEPKLAIAHVWLAKAYSREGNLVLARQAAEQARSLGYMGEISERGLAQ